jgi:ribosomal protein L29
MAVSDTVTGALIGGGAALAAGIIAGTFGLILDSRRQRWEALRRWDDARRLAYVNFLYAARQVYAHAVDLVESRLQLIELRKQMQAARLENPADVAEIEDVTGRLESRVQNLVARTDEFSRFQRVYDEIYLIASRHVREAAERYLDAISAVHDLHGKVASMDREELRAQLDELKALRRRTTETFRRAVSEELGVDRWIGDGGRSAREA